MPGEVGEVVELKEAVVRLGGFFVLQDEGALKVAGIHGGRVQRAEDLRGQGGSTNAREEQVGSVGRQVRSLGGKSGR